MPHSLPVRLTQEWTALPTHALRVGFTQLLVSTYVIILTVRGQNAIGAFVARAVLRQAQDERVGGRMGSRFRGSDEGGGSDEG